MFLGRTVSSRDSLAFCSYEGLLLKQTHTQWYRSGRIYMKLPQWQNDTEFISLPQTAEKSVACTLDNIDMVYQVSRLKSV